MADSRLHRAVLTAAGVPQLAGQYLNRRSCEARKLFDVLPLLADDGAYRQRWDEEMDGLRFRLLLEKTGHPCLVDIDQAVVWA